MRSSSISYVALAAALTYAPIALAQDAQHLGEIVLSGGWTPIDAAKYGRAYSVVTAQEIESRGITSVQDALRALPGVSVNGSGRSFTQIRMRGGEANHTLVLIDGVEAVGGGDEYGFSGLDAADIERIEVLRGPQSVYYGSNASSGVINIITKRGGQKGYGGKLEAGNGHFANIYAQNGNERGGIRLSVTDSYDKGVDESGDGGERDFIDRQALRVNGDWKATDTLTLRADVMMAREHYAHDKQNYPATDAASSVVDKTDLFGWKRESILSFGAALETLDGRFLHDIALSKTASKTKPAANGAWTKGSTTSYKYRSTFGIDGAVSSADHLMNILVERQEDENNSAPDYARDMNSYALEYRGSFGDFSLQAGLRYDDNKVFDDFTGYNFALVYQLNDQLRLHSSYGRASVNPSYYELYADDRNTLGNPLLAPEENRGFDLGLAYSSLDGRLSGDVTLFSEVLYDEISTIYGVASDDRATYYNQAGKSRRKGVEVSGRWQATGQLSFGVNYTYLKATNPDQSKEVRRPRHELGLQASWASADDRFSVTGDLRHVAGNYDTQYVEPYPVAELPNYTVVNLSGRYALSENIDVTAKVLNVFDKEYSDVWGYRAQDRAIWVGLSANF